MATLAQIKQFIDVIAPMIKAEGNKRGYNIVSTAIAQACIESAYGTSSLGFKYHNYFGMKAGKSWKGGVVNLKTKEEYTVGTLTTIVDGFRTYPTLQAGVEGYYDFISAKRYANLKTAKDYKEYATFLKQDGYATSSTYINTLCKTVEKYELDKYDTIDISSVGANAGITKPAKSNTRPIIKMGSISDDVLYLNKKLYALHYGVNPNSKVFDAITDLCVKNFQATNGLVVDGIVGPATWAKIG